MTFDHQGNQERPPDDNSQAQQKHGAEQGAKRETDGSQARKRAVRAAGAVPRSPALNPAPRPAIQPVGRFRPRLIIEMADFDALSTAQVRMLMRAFELRDVTLADLEPLSRPGGELAGLLPWDQLRARLGADCRFGRLRNGLNLAVLRELEERAHDIAQLYAPLRYYSLEPVADVTDVTRTNARSALDTLANQATFGIKNAYEVTKPASLPAPPKLPVGTNQTFLKAAFEGINAEVAWNEPGGYGHDVRFVDIEYSWYLEHPDLPAVETIYEDDFTYTYTDLADPENAVQDHGTAMLGIVVAQHNNAGDAFGIAPAAEAYVLSSLLSDATHDLPGTILQACISVLRPGDVLLIEGQMEHVVNGVTMYLPVEVDRAVFEAIRFAVNLGVIVVEPAANSNQNLNTLHGRTLGYPAGTPLAVNLLNKTGANWNPNLMDSGAIMVAAGQRSPIGASSPYAQWTHSPFGSRIDCFAHGDRVWSLSNQKGAPYRAEQGGTSAAAAIVAGVAILVQSIYKQKNGGESFLSPARVRELLSRNGTRSDRNRFGRMPDLQRIVPLVKNEPIARPTPKPAMPASLAGALAGPAVARDIPRLATPI